MVLRFHQCRRILQRFPPVCPHSQQHVCRHHPSLSHPDDPPGEPPDPHVPRPGLCPAYPGPGPTVQRQLAALLGTENEAGQPELSRSARSCLARLLRDPGRGGALGRPARLKQRAPWRPARAEGVQDTADLFTPVPRPVRSQGEVGPRPGNLAGRAPRRTMGGRTGRQLLLRCRCVHGWPVATGPATLSTTPVVPAVAK